MSWYQALVTAHVVTAVLGVGQTASLVTLSQRNSATAGLLLGLCRVMQWSFAIMLVTGGLLVAETQGALLDSWWLRISLLFMLLLGVGFGSLRQRLNAKVRSGKMEPISRDIQVLAWILTVLVALIVSLMVAKP